MNKRRMLSFVSDKERFNYRVAGLVLHKGHLLVCREDDNDFTLLPGGRVEFGEASDLALRREIGEELKCPAHVGRLLFSVENFFEREGELFHELAHYYALELPGDFPFVTGRAALVTHDEGHLLTFDWIPAQTGELEQINLLPQWIRSRLDDLPLQSEHLIVDER